MKLFKPLSVALSTILGLSFLSFSAVSYSLDNLRNNITVLDTPSLSDEISIGLNTPNADLIEPTELEEKYPVSILLVGSDTRAGQGDSFGKASGARSDTTIILKMNELRTSAAVISIARDLWVKIPECNNNAGGVTKEQYNKFNAAYAFGGAECMVLTLRENFGIEINHVAVVDFLGFQQIVDVLGGVQICVAKDIKDRASGLNLIAGEQLLNGKDSLAFVRARQNIGDGSDISRTERQKMFLASMFNTAKENGTFYDIPKLYNLADTISKSLSVDPELASIEKMIQLAIDLNNVGTKNVQFVFLPWQSNGDGSISLKDESYLILDNFNGTNFPIISDKVADEQEASERDDREYRKSDFNASVDMCSAKIK